MHSVANVLTGRMYGIDDRGFTSFWSFDIIEGRRSFGLYASEADLSFGGRPRLLGTVFWVTCSTVDVDLSALGGVIAALLLLELRRVVDCLMVPSADRFREGETTIVSL